MSVILLSTDFAQGNLFWSLFLKFNRMAQQQQYSWIVFICLSKVSSILEILTWPFLNRKISPTILKVLKRDLDVKGPILKLFSHDLEKVDFGKIAPTTAKISLKYRKSDYNKDLFRWFQRTKMSDILRFQ